MFVPILGVVVVMNRWVFVPTFGRLFVVVVFGEPCSKTLRYTSIALHTLRRGRGEGCSDACSSKETPLREDWCALLLPASWGMR